MFREHDISVVLKVMKKKHNPGSKNAILIEYSLTTDQCAIENIKSKSESQQSNKKLKTY